MPDYRRPSLRFRLWQLFYLPWRIFVCPKKGHEMHKWACRRCLRVDEVLLAAHHMNHILQKGRLMKRWDEDNNH